jgi:hypothetical protein
MIIASSPVDCSVEVRTGGFEDFRGFSCIWFRVAGVLTINHSDARADARRRICARLLPPKSAGVAVADWTHSHSPSPRADARRWDGKWRASCGGLVCNDVSVRDIQLRTPTMTRRRSRKPSMEAAVERIVIMPATVGRWRKNLQPFSVLRSFEQAQFLINPGRRPMYGAEHDPGPSGEDAGQVGQPRDVGSPCPTPLALGPVDIAGSTFSPRRSRSRSFQLLRRMHGIRTRRGVADADFGN